MPLDEGLVVDLCLEFLEAFFHQILYQRQVYSPELFHKKRLYGIAVWKARHPELCQYVQDVVTSLKVPLRQNTLAKLALVIKSPEGQALERFIIEPKLLATNPAVNNTERSPDILELEAHLRAVLLKLQYIDSALSDRLPRCSSFEILAYTTGRAGMAVDAWLPEQPPLDKSGLELGESGEIVPLKSVRIDHAVQLQLYIERQPGSRDSGTQ